MNTDSGINGSIEVTSGDSITLICEIEQTELSDDMTVDYEWSREDDIPLPDGATQNNGVCVCARVFGKGRREKLGRYIRQPTHLNLHVHIYNYLRIHSQLSPSLPLSVSISMTTGELTITDVQEGDSGVYICSANGVSGSLTLSVG